ADVLGRDRLDDRGGGLLGVDGPFDRGTDAGNDDAVELGGLFAVRRRGGVLREGLRCGKQDRGCERGTQQGAPGLQHFPLPKGNVVIGSCGLARRSTRVMTGRRTFAGRAAMVVAAASSGAVLHTYSCALSARENSVLRARRPRATKPHPTPRDTFPACLGTGCGDRLRQGRGRRGRYSRAAPGLP